MKLSYKLIAATMAFAGMVACTPDEFSGANPLEYPSIEEVKDNISVTVDQTTNTVTFLLDAKASMPLWIFETDKGTTYSTRNGLQKIYTLAGDYSVKVKVGNRNGWSDFYVEKTFHIDNTIFDFGKYEGFLAGAAGNAEWRIDYATKGHMGCGPSGTEGLEWWSADPSAKANEGVYDDRITFSGDGKYTYTPGEGGTMYVNYGASIFPEFNTQKEKEIDFMANVEKQESSYSLTVEGTDLILTLNPNTYFPYIPNDDFWANPRFVVLSMNSKTMELVTDNGGIAWHFILTSVKDVEVFKGFKYDSEFNMWKTADVQPVTFWYAPGWNEIEGPEVVYDGNKSYTFTFPTATTETWQAQTKIISNVALSASKKYDVSFIISANKDIPKATAKLHKMNSLTEADDNTALFAEVGTLNVKAGEDFVYFATELDGIDADLTRWVFDFGSCPDNTEVTISNIVIKDHANDDGTVLPSPTPDGPADVVVWNDAANLITSAEKFEIFYAVVDWNNYEPAPEFSEENGLFTTTLPLATTERWKAQYKFHTNASTAAGKVYDFKMSFTPSKDMKKVTVKLVKSGDDGTFLTDAQHDLVADEENVIVVPNLEGVDIDKLDIVIDFGGNEENTTVTFGKFHLQERKVVSWDFDSEKNLFKSSDVAVNFYYAPGWNALPAPDVEKDGKKSFSFTFPTATSAQWQAQTFFVVNTPMSADKNYNISFKITSNKTMKATAKLHRMPSFEGEPSDADNGVIVFNEDKSIALEADETYTYKGIDLPGIDAPACRLVIDFGGNEAGTEITISEIIICEAE